MKHNILAISSAIDFLKHPFVPSHTSLLFTSLQSIAQALQHSINDSKLSPFFETILIILTQRFYEIAVQKIVVPQDYVLMLMVKLIEELFRKASTSNCILRADLGTIILWANIACIKDCLFQARQKAELLEHLLTLNELMVEHFLHKFILSSTPQFNIQTIYPRQYSMLSTFLNHQSYGIHLFQRILVILARLVLFNFEKSSTIYKVGYQFQLESMKRLTLDLAKIINRVKRHSEIAYKLKVKAFFEKILLIFEEKKIEMEDVDVNVNVDVGELGKVRKSLLKEAIMGALFVEVNVLAIRYSLEEREFIHMAIKEEFEGVLTKLANDTNFIDEKHTLMQEASLLIPHLQQPNSQIILDFLSNCMFKIEKSHCLIEMRGSMASICLDAQEWEKCMLLEMVNIFPFASLEDKILRKMRDIVNTFQVEQKIELISLLSESLLSQEYHAQQSLFQFYQFSTKMALMANLFYNYHAEPVLWQTSLSNRDISSVISLFNFLTLKNQDLNNLSERYLEEELLQCFILQTLTSVFNLVSMIYSHQLATQKTNFKLKKKLMQMKIVFLQKVINYLDCQSSLIKACASLMLGRSASSVKLSQFLKDCHLSLLARNRTNLHFLSSLIKLVDLEPCICEELALHYLVMGSSGTELVLEMLPYVSAETIRVCILSSEHFEKLLTKETMGRLNNKELRVRSEHEHFVKNDGPNVVISNALGVIMLELNEKWRFNLASTRRELIIDLLICLVTLNPHIIFFRSFFKPILQDLNLCFIRCFGFDSFTNFNQIHYSKHVLSSAESRLTEKILQVISGLPAANWASYGPEIYNQINQIKQMEECRLNQELFWNKSPSIEHRYQILNKISENMKEDIG